MVLFCTLTSTLDLTLENLELDLLMLMLPRKDRGQVRAMKA